MTASAGFRTENVNSKAWAVIPGDFDKGLNCVTRLPLISTNNSVSAGYVKIKKRILIVDGDFQTGRSLSGILESEGYEVAFATDANNSMIRFIEWRPNLVILDLDLKGARGWDIFGAFAASDPFAPVIIVTGQKSESELAMVAGARAVMEKPLDIPLLLKTVTEIIAEKPQNHLKRLVGISGLDETLPKIPLL